MAHLRAPWILGVESLDSTGLADASADEALPDISIDPEEKVLSAINVTDRDRCYFISLPARCGCIGARGRILQSGMAKSLGGLEEQIVAFILVLGPRAVMDVCKLKSVQDVRDVEVQSDIFDMPPPASISSPESHRFSYRFPFQGPESYLCSQGFGGRLTHFAHSSTFYALDFDCPLGTPVHSMADGMIAAVKELDHVSGVDVRNFFRWNQVQENDWRMKTR